MDLLGTYLNDHLGGATGGLELARRCRDSNRGTKYGPVLEDIADEIEGDRDALIALIEELGYRRDPVKVAGAWVGEKAGRLKPNGSLFSYSPLSRVIELEGLTIGVTGKLALWENLRDSGAAATTSLALEDLIKRARSQRTRLARLRRQAASEAFTG